MISDEIKKLTYYETMIPHGKEILSYLESVDLLNLEVGKYPIVGDKAFLLIQEYDTQPENEKFWESHNRFMDIQIVLKGEEFLGYSPISALSIKNAYDSLGDYTLYENKQAGFTLVYSAPGQFQIFFPGDGHKPGCAAGSSTGVKKAVIKVQC